MNILIFGSNGMLGSTLKKYFENKYSIISHTRQDIDLANCSSYELQEYTASSKPDIVLNCVGLIKQRPNIYNDEMISINSVLPHRLSRICENLSIKMIHFSTDCVYDGNKGNYVESDDHNAKDLYGISKSLGEPMSCTVIRSSIIGEENYNKLSLVEWVKSKRNQEINGFVNHFWNGMTCLQMGKVVEKIIKHHMFWFGTKHFYSNSLNKFELVSIINNIYDLNIKIKPVQDSCSIDRTLNSLYDISDFGISNLYDQIKEMKYFHA